MAIVKVHNKSRNITYVYESHSYWDKELKQPRSHRKLIGRIDPATGEIIPTGKRLAPAASSAADRNSDTNYKALYEQAVSALSEKYAIISGLKYQLAAAEKENKDCRRSIRRACNILTEFCAEKEHGNE